MKKRPNLLLIQTDQQKATSLDLYSNVNAIKTENLRELANEGVTFDTAYCPYPLCVPSRISMLSGQYPSTHGYLGNTPWHVAGKVEDIFSLTKKNGYHTMLIGKDHALGLPGRGGQKEKWIPKEPMKTIFDRIYSAWHGAGMTPETNRDNPQLQPFLNSAPQLKQIWGSEVAPFNSDETISASLATTCVDWLTDWHNNDETKDKPFSVWLSFPDPHEFYQCPKDVYDMIDPDDVQLYPNWESDISNRAEFIQFFHWYFNAGDPIPEEVALKLIRVYLAMCKNVDMQLGKVFDHLKETGEWENTVIVFTSDHGDFTGEHQLLQKFNCGYDGCCRVPLIVAQPGKTKAGIHSTEPVNLTDIPSTLCELLELEKMENDQGIPFTKSLMGEEEEREFTIVESGIVSENLTCKDIPNFPNHKWNVSPDGRWCYDPPHRFGGRMYAIRSKHYKLIVRQEQRSEFYDMKNDPWETKNRIDEPKLQQEILRHHRGLIEHLARISFAQPGTKIAGQDTFYRAGGNKTWSESLKEHRENKK